MLHQILQGKLLRPRPLGLKPGEELAAPGFVRYQRCQGREVSLHALFQVEGKRGVSAQVGKPVTAAYLGAR